MPNPLHVLLVEDSADDADLICLELRRSGFQVEPHRVDTEGAFRLALGSSWDVILSDYHMPSFDGLRAFEIYRAAGLDTPFIFVSGALGEERAVRAMLAGARDYVLKGNLARLGAAIHRELAQARTRASARVVEELRRQEQERLSVAVEATSAGIFEYTLPPAPRSGYQSPQWAQIVGIDGDDRPGEDVVEWLEDRAHPDDRELFRATRDAFIAGRSPRHQVEFRLRHPRRGWLDVALFAQAAERRDAQATRVVGVLMDLSQQRVLERQAQEAQKMQAVGRLAGGVAHDFSNLLTIMFNFGALAMRRLDLDAPARSDVEGLLSAARKAHDLTSQLLAFSRSQPISPRVVHLGRLIGGLGRLLDRSLGETIERVTTCAPDLWNVRIDPGSFEQVMLNLGSNARDAMADGGVLRVGLRNVSLPQPQPIGAAVAPAGDYVRVDVADDGCGMDAATRERIFEPFFTTKAAGKGTGLGLASCLGIVEQAGGFVAAASEVGRGTTFSIYLPRVTDAAADEAAPEAEPTRRDLRGSETILLVEDQEQVRRAAAQALGNLGYRVKQAPGGKAALDVIASAPKRIDLLLSDLLMPEMGGHELAERAVVLRPRLRVLLMSGQPEAIARAEADGGLPVLKKPFTPDDLARHVRDVLDR